MSPRIRSSAGRRPAPRGISRGVAAGVRLIVLGSALILPARASAEPVDFNLPPQPVASALLDFARQARVEILFSYDELRQVRSTEVSGRFDPEEALSRLLRGTGFLARRDAKGKFGILRATRATGSIRGKLLTVDGAPAPRVAVTLVNLGLSTSTDERGQFSFSAVPPDVYRLEASGSGYQPLVIPGIRVLAGRETIADTRALAAEADTVRMAPFLVSSELERERLPDGRGPYLGPRVATGNLDLPRTADDALPYTIYTRDQIAHSGSVNLNEFIQRELPDSDATTLAPDQLGNESTFKVGSTNLNLRAYGEEETVVLVNGRRLPEIVNSTGLRTLPPDVNFIPLSLVQQIEVLPASAAALYTGNPVGGVINIVLRPDPDGTVTEVSTTYTNALRGFDAPQSSVSLLHGRTLLDGALRVRLSATFTRALPATEAELGYIRHKTPAAPALSDAVYGATPNVRSTSLAPLFGTASSPVTSVPPGADGTQGLAAFTGRQGIRNQDLFDSPGGWAASNASLDYPYGRRQRRTTYFGSATYDALPWLQLGADGIYSLTVAGRGLDVFTADLALAADSPLNPFGQAVQVSLIETASQLGESYSEARTEFASGVFGALLKLPSDWRVSLDAQYAHNLSKYRGVYGADATRWQALVDAGSYNPLRDTQAHGPPPEFYNQTLIYYGARGRFVTLGSYDTIDASAQVTNQSLVLPTGVAAVHGGVDYRRMHLADFSNVLRYGDGSLAATPVTWQGRILQRYSAFGEIQSPVLPAKSLPRWLKRIESDLALRYVAADTSRESYLAPTAGFKVDFAGGLSLRGSFTFSNRYPTPYMSKQVATPSAGGGSGEVSYTQIYDPVRDQTYNIPSRIMMNPDLQPESATTQTAGVIFQRGREHRVRVGLDFVDTRKTNELVSLGPQELLDLESLFPNRVIRAALASGDQHKAGLVSYVLTGDANVAWWHSRNWNANLDYAWNRCLGGTLNFYAHLVWFQHFDREVDPNSAVVDELRHPDGAVTDLLQRRTNFGAGWSKPDYGFGWAGHYYGPRILPEVERASQGSDRIRPFCQFDAYVQGRLDRWLPWKSPRFSLRGQLRVNHVLGANLPRYANESSGAGVQPYGDWRGRTYSLSLTATF